MVTIRHFLLEFPTKLGSKDGHFNELEGTLAFWIKPSWEGSDQTNHSFLAIGSGHGMIFARDHGYLRMIANRGYVETDCTGDLSQWHSGSWHHAVFTWSNKAGTLKVYIDGTLAGTRALNLPLAPIDTSNNTAWIGSDSGTVQANATLDELSIYDHALTDAEVNNLFFAGLTITGLQISPKPLSLLNTWYGQAAVTAMTNVGTLSVPASSCTWQSDNPSIATVDVNGQIHAVGAGTAHISASRGGVSDQLPVSVIPPALPPYFEKIPTNLSKPPAAFLYDVPVVILRYIPTKDGVTVDSNVADYIGTIGSLTDYISRLEGETKFMLTEGSRYHGYKDPNSIPSLGYRVVKIIDVFEEMPPDLYPSHSAGPNVYFPDYKQILERFHIKNFVEMLGVKEVWIWGYHHGSIVPVESNMSSPTTGDISNSARYNDDLPVYSRTYTVYNYNFTRSSNESVHDHGHQLESIYGYIAKKQDGNDDLFWKLWDGRDDAGNKITGRCGNTHMPPNTTVDYDYYNTTPVLSDCEDWTPANTGAKKLVSDSTWGDLFYSWPLGQTPSDIVQHNYYIYWMQNMCGLEQSIPHPKGTMTNWWSLTGDWDNSAKQADAMWGLYAGGMRSVYFKTVVGTMGVGDTAYLVVNIAKPAPVGGTLISLSQTSSGGGQVILPPSLTIPAGQTSAQTTVKLVNAGRVSVHASAGGKTLSCETLVGPSILIQVLPASRTIVGGQPSTVRVTVKHATGPAGTTISVSGSSLIVAPTSVLIPPGQASVLFKISTKPVSASTKSTLTVSNGAADVRKVDFNIVPVP